MVVAEKEATLQVAIAGNPNCGKSTIFNALTGLRQNQRRNDFMPDEMKEGTVLYFEQADNLSGGAVYRMHIAEASANRVVFDVENASTIRRSLVTPRTTPCFTSADTEVSCSAATMRARR